MKDAWQLFYFRTVRALERRLSVGNLYRTLLPVAFLRAAVNTAFKSYQPCVPLPPCLQTAWSARLSRQQRMRGYLNLAPEFFPDRLASPKWRDRCRIMGLEHVQPARQGGRPIVFAFIHFGPFEMIRVWLRAAGIPAGAFYGVKVKDRRKLRRQLDQYFPSPEIPTIFCSDQLREALAFLAAGNQLCIAMDVPRSVDKKVEVPFCEGWTFQMNTGAVRLAGRQEAELIPVTIVDEGGWRFQLILGRPVPRELLASEDDWPRAGKHLIDEMMPYLQAHPEQCKRNLMLCLKKNSANDRKN